MTTRGRDGGPGGRRGRGRGGLRWRWSGAALVAAAVAATWSLGGCAGSRTQVAQEAALAGDAVFAGDVLATGLASGRDAADGPERLWLADERRVWELSKDAVAPVERWRAPRFSRIVRFEAADLDGDGADEWVVLLDQGRMRSAVVEVAEDGVRSMDGRPFGGYLRPIVGADGALTLVAQHAGADAPFRGQVRRIARTDDGKWKPGESLGLPADVAIFDFFWLDGRLFGAEASGKLQERDPRSLKAVLWRSDVRVAGRPLEIERSYQNMLGEEQEAGLRLLPPWVRVGDGELILAGGVHNPVAMLRDLRVWQGGDVRLMRLADRGLEEVRRTPLLGRAVVAVADWEIAEGEHVWAAAVWTRAAGGFVKPESRVFLFDPETGNLLGGSSENENENENENEPEPEPENENEPEPEPEPENENEPEPENENENEPPADAEPEAP